MLTLNLNPSIDLSILLTKFSILELNHFQSLIFSSLRLRMLLFKFQIFVKIYLMR